MFCSECGQKQEAGSKFCSNCGKKIETSEVVTNVVPVENVVIPTTPVITPVNNYQTSNSNNKNKIALFVSLGLVALIALFIFIGNGLPGGTKKRTIMIYISASNLESDVMAATSDLNSIYPGDVDLDNMNVIIYTGGSKKWYNFVDSKENAIYELTKSGFTKKQTYDVLNMTEPETLASFLNYGYKNYKADKYDLIIYSHGGAWAGAIADDNYERSPMMSLSDFKNSFDNSPFKNGNKLEGVIFRTCINSSYELLTVFKDYADYLVASEEITFGGASVHVLDFLNDITGNMDFITVGNKFAESYYQNTVVRGRLDKYVMAYSTIDLSKVDTLSNEVGNFFQGINVNTNYNTLSRVRNGIHQYARSQDGGDDFDIVDLYYLVDKLKTYSSYDSNKVLSAIDDLVINCYTNTYGKSNSKCLSIYFPYRGSKLAKEMGLQTYLTTNINDKYYDFINTFVFKQKSSSTSKAMLELDNGHFTNNININKKILNLNLTDEEKDDILSIKYYVFKKDGKEYKQIKYSDDTVIDGNTLMIDLSKNYLKLGNEYLSINIDNGNYTLNGYLTKNDKYNKNDFVTYDLDDKGSIVNINKRLKKENGISYVLLNQDDYDNYNFTSYTYDKVDNNFKNKVSEENSLVKKDEVNLAITNLDSGEFYIMLEVLDMNNNVHYTNINRIN